MSQRRSRRGIRRVAALLLATGGAAGVFTAAEVVPTQASSAAVKCGFATHELDYTPIAPARVIAHAECVGDGSLFVKVFRNGTLIWSGGDGVGIVTAIHNCQGTTSSDYTAVWSTGQTDEQVFPCS